MIEEFLLNPNVAYLLLVGGILFAMMAVLTPGTGVIEVCALILLVLAGYTVYNLPINFWALGVLLLGVIPFLLALRKSKQLIYLVVAIAALVVGSTFLFNGEGWKPAVNPVLAVVVSVLVGGFVWLVANKTLEVEKTRPVHDLEALIGVIGEAKTDIHADGSVQVAGELWTARSKQPVPLGSRVRVIGRDGFILEVEQEQG